MRDNVAIRTAGLIIMYRICRHVRSRDELGEKSDFAIHSTIVGGVVLSRGQIRRRSCAMENFDGVETVTEAHCYQI